MVSGGLLDLVARGIQDAFIIGNPQITYFKQLYKRHTNFTIESINISLNGNPDFGQHFTCELHGGGDLLHALFLEIDLPAIVGRTVDPTGGTDTDYDKGRGSISWINNIGHGIIEHVDFKIGGQIIDTQYGEWMEIWTQLSMSVDRKEGLDYMLARSAHPATDGPKPVVLDDPRRLIVPLQFWFCRNIGLALPLIALTYHAVELEFYFHPLSRCYTFGTNNYYRATGTTGASTINLVKVNNNTQDANTFKARVIMGHTGESYYIHPTTTITGNGTTLSPFVMTTVDPLATDYTDELVYIRPNGAIADVGLSLDNVRLYGDYVYLDNVERKEFALGRHRYLIEQVQFRPGDTISASGTNHRFPINFNLPIKELVWVLQQNDVFLTNDVFNFSHTVDPAIVRDNMVSEANITFNGSERFETRNGDYFRLTVPFQRHTRVPQDYYYVYSFAMRPEEHQPSGVSNFSKIQTVYLNLGLRSPSTTGGSRIQLRVYALSYNILRIMNGMGGVAFSN